MKKGIFTIVENAALTDSVRRMCLAGDASAVTAPGQFVEIELPEFFLRRPISVCDWDENGLTLVYKTVGRGTDAMSRLAPGAQLDLLTGLGNGYDLTRCPEDTVLVGGGVGVPPMYGLAKSLIARGIRPRVVLGFNTAEELFMEDAFRALGLEVTVTTADGSYGLKGFVTEALSECEAYICACGPEPMLRAIYPRCADGQFSFEERMGCGFGACMGCSIETKFGVKRVCRDGPVFEREEIIWQTRA